MAKKRKPVDPLTAAIQAGVDAGNKAVAQAKRPKKKAAPKKLSPFLTNAIPTLKPAPAPRPKAKPKKSPTVTNALAGITGDKKVPPARKPAARPKPKAKPAGPTVAGALAAISGNPEKNREVDKLQGRVHAALQKSGRGRRLEDIHIKTDPETGQRSVLIKERRNLRPDSGFKLSLKDALAGEENKARPSMKDATTKASAIDAAGLKILEQTLRPIYGVANAADAAVTGKPVLDAAVRGVQLKDKTLFSDVLKHAGVSKGLAGPLGFALDVLADPTTYITGGLSAVGKAEAKKAAQLAAKSSRAAAEQVAARAAQDSLRRSAARGVPAAKAREVAARKAEEAAKAHMVAAGERAARAAARKIDQTASKGRGVDLRVAGKSVPGVVRGTAAVGRGTKRAAALAPAPVKKVGNVGKEQVREVRPTMTPAGANASQYVAARQVARESRAASQAGAAAAEREARGLRKRIDALRKKHGDDIQDDMIHAIETRTIGKLPADAQKVAREVRDHYRYMKRIRVAAGVREGTIRDYFPHAREDALHARMGIVEDATTAVRGSGARRTGPNPEGSGRRTDRRPLREVNVDRVARGESKHSTDVPLVTQNYVTSTKRTAAENKAFRDLAAVGKPYKVGDTLKAGEAVYHLGFAGKNSRYGLRPVKDGEGKRAGQYVVLDEKTVETVMQRLGPQVATTQLGRAFDRTTAGFKRVATFTPGFHIRNAIGDTQMAYLAQPGGKLIRNTAQARKINKALTQLEKNQGKRLGASMGNSGKTVKVAGQRVPVEQVAAAAQKAGVTQSGQLTRELVDLASAGVGTRAVRGGKVRRAGQAVAAPVSRAVRSRENITRLSTFKHGLDTGMSTREAADLSLKTHIDYGDLTQLERKLMRRAMPFYTFSARAIPLHAEKLITHPGKFAAYAKLIAEGGKAAGLESDFWNNVDVYRQRQLGVPIKVGGDVVIVSAGLPITTLNELPVGLSPNAYATEVLNYLGGLTNPVLKDPVELWANYSTFFRNEIRPPGRPLVAAPKWVEALPDAAKKRLGVTTLVDPKTGDTVPAWDAKTNYVFKAIPGPVALVQNLMTEGTSRRGQGPAAKLIGAAGIKVDDYDPAKVALDNAYKLSTKINNQRGKLRQQLGSEYAEDPDYQNLMRKQKEVDAARDMLREQDPDLPPLKKKAAASSPSSGWGDSSSPASGGGSSGNPSGWGDGGGTGGGAGPGSSSGWGDGG